MTPTSSSAAIRFQIRTRSDIPKVLRKVRRANIENLGHAGASVRLTAKRSIRKSANPAEPGRPPKTRRGQLRSAIRFAVESNRQRVLIGPDHRFVGQSARAHEFGGRYRKQRYPKRPFMGPALTKTQSRLPRHWAGSVR